MFMRRECFSWRLFTIRCTAVLLLTASLNALASDACLANFTHGGDVATGLSFSASRTISGLSPGDAIEQYKHAAATQGFKIGKDSLRHGQGELLISQLPSINGRGFDMHVVANANGQVAVSTKLPAGMSATPEAFSANMCEALNQIGVGKTAASMDGADGTSAIFAPSPQQRTDLCLANFMSQGTSVEGKTYSTWSIGMAMEVSDSVSRINEFVNATPRAVLTTEVIHGTKASLTLSLGGKAPATTVSSDVSGQRDADAFPIRIDLDASLDAASFTAHLNPEQENIGQDYLGFMACTMIAAAISGAPLPPAQKASRFHFRNPFKNEQAAAHKKYDQQIALMRSGRTLLYKRAVRAGKAIVFVPMLNVDHKYAQAIIKSLTPGGRGYPAFRFDETANLIWRSANDHDALLKVGEQVSLFNEGLFGSIQTLSANKSRYGIYILDPGSYELMGLTYQMPHTTLPPLTAKKWTETPLVGSTTFAIIRNAEFYDSQAWFDAQYQNVSVSDGSYCTATVTPGSDQGCVNWQSSYHNETRLSDPGGWRTVTNKGYAGGLAVSVNLKRPFASFEAKAGQVLVTDGFAAVPESLATDASACRQAGENLINCVVSSLTLFLIPGKISDLAIPTETAKKFPMVAGFISTAKYEPLVVHAKRLDETPGTYEAAWATPYRAPVN
jgi:hypothetical protein